MKMQNRVLGRTGLSVSEIGFGGIPIQKIGEKEAVDIIRKSGKCGVNFIDTGRAYNDSERKIGLAIKNERKKWIIASKSPAVTYERMKQDVLTGLKELNADVIELYQLHHIKSESMLKEAMKKNGAYVALKEFQKEGKINFIGITSHEPKVLEKAIKTDKFDTVMASYNYFEREAETLIKTCKKKNIGVIIMKPLAGGLIQNAPSAIRFCLSNDGVSSVIPGIHTDTELKEDVIDVLKSIKFTGTDKKKLDKEGLKKEKYCHACGYCVNMNGGCPKKINIFYFLALDGYYKKFGPQKWIIGAYKNQPVTPDQCIFCGHCESICPFGIPIMRVLRDLKIREHVGEINNNDFEKKRDYHAEKKALDDMSKKQLGRKWAPPVVYYKYRRGSNPGQRATVLKLIEKFNRYASVSEQEAIKILCKEMKISPKGIHRLRDLAMLSDYDNAVDIMRILPTLTKKK
jgi:predicted aldo/keto reductase-like oxidoreductase